MEQKNRILWVDFSKGVVMLLVIVGHSSIPTIIRGAIYSFHMPLFFLLSGYTTKCSETKQDILQRVKKTAKGLLLTAYLLWITRTLIYLLIGRVNYSLPQMFFSAIWAGGEEYEFWGLNIPAMGMTWFLVVLFILRNIYDVLQCLTKKHLTLISVCITFLGMLIGHWIQLPFSFDLALFSFVFYHCGQILKHKGIQFSTFKCVTSAMLAGGGAAYRICNLRYISRNDFKKISNFVYNMRNSG